MRLLGTLLLFLGAAHAASQPADIITTIKSFEEDAIKLHKPAREVNCETSRLFVIKKGPLYECIKGLEAAVEKGKAVGSSLEGTEPYGPNKQAHETHKAYVNFSRSHIRLFDLLSEGADTFNISANGHEDRSHAQPKIGKPTYDVLRKVQETIDDLSAFLINTVDVAPYDFDRFVGTLNHSLNTCIGKWKHVCGKKCS
ncbi:hypothetical protein JX265_001086 [Neoarthrinium moseri]|uniref:Uncharacterized protein n=1 Tax=Neoarthrinium moseri TaxID=1658444 RepID=A0A9P9WX47_9PEZI|nr:hypothetical protein JX265_001086 [Neoarthrinium moseri]